MVLSKIFNLGRKYRWRLHFIGLRAMGLLMARRLIKAGYSLKIVKHRNTLPVEEIAHLGAKVHENVAEAASEIV
ncbi:NAD(P)-binding domain-containing protein [Fictibacillus enclensis]|uniref:NAD(P)-binding domain-containing protein n=1 Tax=Fictibacillus enclensis TaxID=1017270 RepID=UPI003CD0C47B